MNPDATDLLLVLGFVICVMAIFFTSLVRTAYRAGYWAGKRQGVLWEQKRRRKVEERVEERINETFKSMEWERELDC